MDKPRQKKSKNVQMKLETNYIQSVPNTTAVAARKTKKKKQKPTDLFPSKAPPIQKFPTSPDDHHLKYGLFPPQKKVVISNQSGSLSPKFIIKHNTPSARERQLLANKEKKKSINKPNPVAAPFLAFRPGEKQEMQLSLTETKHIDISPRQRLSPLSPNSSRIARVGTRRVRPHIMA